jgi:osmotically-inducible protein OsmY
MENMRTAFLNVLLAGAFLGLGAASFVALAEEPGTAAENPSQEQDAPKSAVGQKLSDAGMTARVKSRLILNEEIDGLRINVDTRNSEVTLNGTVKSETERTRAEEVARNTEGVRIVQNHLKVASRAEEPHEADETYD